MLITKRQIKKDSDRYGGFYGTEDIGRPLVSDFTELTDLEPITVPDRSVGSSMLIADADTDITTPEPLVAPKLMYTTMETAKPRTETPATQPLPERPKKDVKYDKEDILPTVKTRAYATEQHEEEVEPTAAPARRTRKGIDARTKILLCIYVVVALALAIAVIATGVSISRANAQVDTMTVSIEQKQQIVAEQQKTLAVLNDADAIRGKATEKGMVAAGDPAYTVTPVDTVDYPEAKPRTDGFDEFCDWLTKVIN